MREPEQPFVGEARKSRRDPRVDQFPIGKQQSAIGPLRQAAVVGHHQDRFALLGEVVKNGENGFSGARIQVAGGLIGDDNRRVVCQGAGDRCALLLPSGNRRRKLVGVVFQPDHPQQIHGALFALARIVNVAEIHGQHDIFQQGQRGQQLEELKNYPQVAAAPDRHFPFAEIMNACFPNADRTGGGVVDAGNHVDQRRFPAARFSYHADEFARVKVGVDAF
jgi:hypothetical protein